MTAARTKALVTGGTGALGADVAHVLREAGFEVHVSAIDADMASSFAEKPENRGLSVHVGNLLDGDGTKQLMDEVGAPLGALVATLGGFLGGPLAALTDADVDRLIALNLTSAVQTLRHAYPLLKAHPRGARVVLVSARGAVASPLPAATVKVPDNVPLPGLLLTANVMESVAVVTRFPPAS